MTRRNITEEAIRESSAKVLPPNTLLAAMYAAPTAGRLALLGREMACNQAACALVVNSEIADSRYLFYQLLHVRPELHRLANGAAQRNLSARLIRSLEVVVPPLPEQRAIAEVLGALDDKIEANSRVATRCEDLAQSLIALHPPSIMVGALAAVRRQMVSPKSFDGADVEHFSLPAFDARGLPVVEPASAIKSGKFLLEAPAVLVSKLNPHIPRVWMAEPSGTCPALTSTEFVALVPKGGGGVEVLWAICSDPRLLSGELRVRDAESIVGEAV